MEANAGDAVFDIHYSTAGRYAIHAQCGTDLVPARTWTTRSPSRRHRSAWDHFFFAANLATNVACSGLAIPCRRTRRRRRRSPRIRAAGSSHSPGNTSTGGRRRRPVSGLCKRPAPEHKPEDSALWLGGLLKAELGHGAPPRFILGKWQRRTMDYGGKNTLIHRCALAGCCEREPLNR